MLEFDYMPSSADENKAGHVDNVLIYGWFDARRQDLFGTLNWQPQANYFFSIVSATINYQAEVFAGAAIKIRTGVKSIGNSSFVIWQTMEQSGKPCASMESVAVNVDSQSRKSQALSDVMRAKLSKQQVL